MIDPQVGNAHPTRVTRDASKSGAHRCAPTVLIHQIRCAKLLTFYAICKAIFPVVDPDSIA